tara:strand:- start:57 stop:746 length:690 start_codon:yes stop_codon:yes gene_type:complete
MNNYRYEIKFSLDELSYVRAMRWLFVHTHAKKKFEHRYVNSLYFDNPNYSSIRDNLAGISDRSKYRLRWYNALKSPNDIMSPCFEKKIRKGRLGRKEVIPLKNLKDNFPSQSLQKIESDVRLELQKNNILFDDYYTSILGVKYLRQYFEDNEGLRITIDSNIQFSYVDGITSRMSASPKLFNQRYVMELKFDIELKDHASMILKKLNMSPTRHSKYLMGLSKFGSVLYI